MEHGIVLGAKKYNIIKEKTYHISVPNMDFLLFLSNIIIPLLIFYIITSGLLQKQNIYEQFIKGAEDGFRTVVQIMPTLIGLMVAVGILRSSGLLEKISDILRHIVSDKIIPSEIIPVVFVRLFSNSAAIGLVIDIFKNYGADSSLGRIASVLMSSTETVFYTMSVYFMSIHVKKTRWTLPGALFATFIGTAVSILLMS